MNAPSPLIQPNGVETDTAEIATIDPRKVPPEEYQTASRVLASSIRLALSDPANRADFEAWKQRRRGK